MIFYQIFLLCFTVLALVVTFVMLSSLIGFVRTGVPFVRTGFSDIAEIVKQANIAGHDVFYELGSGDGKVVFGVNRLTGARCVGFELTWWTYLLARFRNWLAFPNRQKSIKDGIKWVQFRNQDFFQANWSEATVIYGYLYPPLMGRVEEKFFRDCGPGSRAVIRDFPFPRKQAKRVIAMPGNHELYIYEKE